MKDYEQLSKKHFNAQAAVYDDTDTVLYSKYPKISCADVEKRVDHISYAKLLDVGCGTGYLIERLEKNSGAVFYGLDLSPEMLKVAKRRLGESVYLTEGSAISLPYDSGVFDVVTCVQSFHHYPEPQRAMAEAYRVTAKGGRYILSDTGIGGMAKWLENHIIMRFLKTGDYAVYDNKDIEQMMKQVGFTIESSEWIAKSIYTVVGVKEE